MSANCLEATDGEAGVGQRVEVFMTPGNVWIMNINVVFVVEGAVSKKVYCMNSIAPSIWASVKSISRQQRSSHLRVRTEVDDRCWAFNNYSPLLRLRTWFCAEFQPPTSPLKGSFRLAINSPRAQVCTSIRKRTRFLLELLHVTWSWSKSGYSPGLHDLAKDHWSRFPCVAFVSYVDG